MCRPGSDGGEADDAATTDGGRPAVAGAGGELHGKTHSQTQTIAILEGKFQYFFRPGLSVCGSSENFALASSVVIGGGFQGNFNFHKSFQTLVSDYDRGSTSGAT